jgi:HlyD family secretion protein
MRAVPLLLLVVAAVLAAFGYQWWLQQQASVLPPGIAAANGRIEVERVEVAAKYAGRIAMITVDEGDPVEKGQVIATIDPAERLAELTAAKAAVRQAEAGIGRAQAEVEIRAAELDLAEVELKRAVELERGRNVSAAEVDRRRAQRDVARAMLGAARAAVGDAEAARQVAAARVAQIEAVIADLTLTAPVAGRIEYRLVQPGEIVASGGRVATILDLSDAVMTIFVPTHEAGRIALGSEARIVLDAAPEYVIPARVSFVAAEAQFTPKTVETADERAKLMYRVSLRVDPALLGANQPYVKAGLTGMGYVKLDPDAAWPVAIAEPRLPDAG